MALFVYVKVFCKMLQLSNLGLERDRNVAEFVNRRIRKIKDCTFGLGVGSPLL
jgi:hypothetical protein